APASAKDAPSPPRRSAHTAPLQTRRTHAPPAVGSTAGRTDVPPSAAIACGQSKTLPALAAAPLFVPSPCTQFTNLRSGLRKKLHERIQTFTTDCYVAARFFIKTITQPGTVTVQVAHDQESAEEIFRIVHRFWENLPEGMQKGALMTSRANVRQIVFPRLDSEYRVAPAADQHAGRGMTIHNLHCSEVARWPGDGAETLSSLRSAVPGTERSCWNPLPTARVACFMTNGKGRMRPATCGISFPGGTTRLTRSRMLKTCIH